MRSIVISLTFLLAAGSVSTMIAAPEPRSGGTSPTATPGNRAPVLLSGKVSKVGSSYLLTDENTRITYELRGPDLKNYVGRNVKVQGKVLAGGTPAPGSTEVVEIAEIMRGRVAGTAMSGRAAGAGAKTGLSKAAIAATVGGTAAAGTVGGLYASGAIGSEESPASRP